MGEAKRKVRRKQRFLQEHPICCFCGGIARSTTWDHVPPRACFPEGHCPEGFEFPACEGCNQGTRDHDQIFGFYALITDSDDANYSRATVNKLKRGMANNHLHALPLLWLPANRKRAALRRMGVERQPGESLDDMPLIGVPTVFNDAATAIGRKLACALNYRERGKIIPTDHTITVGWNQLQNRNFEPAARYLAELLPDQTSGSRSNIKNYGQRFGYNSGVKEDEDLFAYVAQFGSGMVVWGMVIAPGVEVGEPLRSIVQAAPIPTIRHPSRD